MLEPPDSFYTTTPLETIGVTVQKVKDWVISSQAPVKWRRFKDYPVAGSRPKPAEVLSSLNRGK